MNVPVVLSWLLGIAVLLPLCSFVLIFLFGPFMGKGGRQAGLCATSAILTSCVLSMVSLVIWLSQHTPHDVEMPGDHARVSRPYATSLVADEHSDPAADSEHGDDHATGGHASADGEHHDEHAHMIVEAVPGYYREVYTLGTFGEGRMSISIYIDSLTIAMFCMVTLIATCIHFYATGYMHDELVEPDYVDHEVTMSDGKHLHRPGRYHRFFQAMSLFCFSMLGLVLSGNIAMTFVFWELVGICSYFLIGFYIERHSASTAANKAFIVNRVGDFGMIIGLMALWGSLGTFAFGGEDGIFAQVRRPENHYALETPAGMVKAAAKDEVATIVRQLGPEASAETIDQAIEARLPAWRDAEQSGVKGGYGRWLLIIAGVGIFCGCVGKSAQFPLHVWLPDAMEGPTPVSALVHSATMVAAGVFLVARFYPVFTPEVLLVIAVVGTITLFLAATIAITATDIKRVLAYSTVSQLGYMMLALGVGGWVAGVMHLITHAFFKSLLFMCSGSVIHAVHTNEMPEMGGLRKKMPWTAYTMLVGCLAIAGAGVPFAITLFGQHLHLGFSGFYSKDAILEQALSFRHANPGWGTVFFIAAAGGAAITAFYMFRLWFLTFAGEPRNQERYDHAHESPPVMYRPLILLATMAIAVAWNPAVGILGSVIAIAFFGWLHWRTSQHAHSAPGHAAHAHAHGHDDHGHHDDHHGHAPSVAPTLVALGISVVVLLVSLGWTQLSDVTLARLIEQARPAGTLPTESAVMFAMTWPSEPLSHDESIRVPATLIAFSTALVGILLAAMFYGLRKLDAAEAQRAFAPLYRLFLNKWWFDELYDVIFVRPTRVIGNWIAQFDQKWIDGIIDGLARVTKVFAEFGDRFADRWFVDGRINMFAGWIYRAGLSLRRAQTGYLRQYVMFIVIGTVVIFAVASFWRYALAH